MSVTEIKERLTEYINTKDENKLTRLWWAAEDIEAEAVERYDHETPEFIAELEQIADDMESGKEPTYTREQIDEMLAQRRAAR